MGRLHGGQPLAADAAAIGEGGLAAFGGVAVQKTMLPLAADLGRLILTFHKIKTPPKAERGTLPAVPDVSSVSRWLLNQIRPYGGRTGGGRLSRRDI